MKYNYLLAFLVCLTFHACQSDEPTVIPEPEVPELPGDDVVPDETPKPELPAHTSSLWKDYIEKRKSGEETLLADFSYAGYAWGEKPVPDVDYPIFNVQDYGAIPNDGKSDRAAFEAAIGDAQKKGKGIIYAPKGRYHLRSADAPNKSIVISGENIVLQGDGMGTDGTELFMEYPNAPEMEDQLWSCPPLFIFRYVAVPGSEVDAKLADVTGNAGRGTFSVELSSTSGLYIGKRVMLKLKNNHQDLVAQEVTPYEVLPEWTDLVNNGVQVIEYHEIQRIEGNKVTFKEPILYPVEAKWGWTLHEYTHQVGAGVEDIAFVGNFKDTFEHHKDATHDSGYKMLTFLRQVNGWIRRCRFTDVSEAVSVQKSANVSVFSCRINGNQGHSAIRSEASTRIFIGDIDDEPAQFHSTGVSKTAIGTVLWRNRSAANTSFESHSYQPRVTLVDACKGGFLPNHGGGDQVSAPNHLRELVLWNYQNVSGEAISDFWTRNNRYYFPWLVGLQGGTFTFNAAQVKINESQGKAVYPESLYEAQLAERLGSVPQWLQELK